MGAVQAVLVGYELMGYRSFTQVFWTVLRGSVSITLVWIGFGPLGHLVANTAAPFATAAVALIVLFSTLRAEDAANATSRSAEERLHAAEQAIRAALSTTRAENPKASSTNGYKEAFYD